MNYTKILRTLALIIGLLPFQTSFLLHCALQPMMYLEGKTFKKTQLNTQLYAACYRTAPFASVEEIAKLIHEGADVNMTKNEHTVLQHAAINGNAIITNYLIKKGAHITKHKQFTLLYMCTDPAITELLLAAGADPRGISILFTELESAIMASHSVKKIIQLLAYGADMHSKNNFTSFSDGSINIFYNYTPLDIALKILVDHIRFIERTEKSIDVIQIKLRSSHVRAIDKEYLQSVLNKFNNTIAIIKVLLCNGADITETSLDLAVSLEELYEENEVTTLLFDPATLLDLQGQTISRLSLYSKEGLKIILDPITTSSSALALPLHVKIYHKELLITIAKVCRFLMVSRHQHFGFHLPEPEFSDAKESKEIKKKHSANK